MQVLNLIRPEKSDVKYNIIQFPDGEPHIILENIDRKDDVTIVCRICDPIDLFVLMQVGDILNRQSVLFSLSIVYLMSMRMDRVMSYNESFSLNVVAQVINDMFPQAVHVLEPHSHKVQDLIDEYRGDISSPRPDFEDYLWVYPDKGAMQRYDGNANMQVLCSKVRDTTTGKLSGFKIENPKILEEIEDKPLIVVDDLCDGGGTFVGIAEELRKAAPNRKLSIYVTHMVNYNGIVNLSKNYDEVYFTNSYKDWQDCVIPDNVKVIEIV